MAGLAVGLASLAVIAAPAPSSLSAAPTQPPPIAALVAPGTGRSVDYPSSLAAPDPAAKARPKLSDLTSGRRGAAVTTCARKCMPGCIRGGAGGPGLGPAAVRRDPVVFGDGFRPRGGCLRECTDVCALKLGGGDQGGGGG